jgi:hypothetical protein
VTTSSKYSEYTLHEVAALHEENHIASRALIQKMKLLVNKRLAKEISLEKFQVDRLEARELQAVLHTDHASLGIELEFRKRNSRIQSS